MRNITIAGEQHLLTLSQRKFASIEVGGIAGFIQYHCKW